MGRTNDPDFWYQQASLFIMYSKFEGFPNALVETMSYGLPVISSNCKTGPQDIISNLENGLLVELSNDREPLMQAMQHMIDNDASVKDMEAAAIAWASETWNVPHFGVKVVTDIVDGDKPTQEEFFENLGTAAMSLQEALPKVIDFVCGKKHDEL